MPYYSYGCPLCGNQFSVQYSIEEAEQLVFCPKCQGLAQRDVKDYQSVTLQIPSSASIDSAHEHENEEEHSHSCCVLHHHHPPLL